MFSSDVHSFEICALGCSLDWFDVDSCGRLGSLMTLTKNGTGLKGPQECENTCVGMRGASQCKTNNAFTLCKSKILPFPAVGRVCGESLTCKYVQ